MYEIQRTIKTLTVLGTCSILVAACATEPGDDPAVGSTEAGLSVAQWSPAVQLPNMLSAQSPALAALNGVAHLNHSGSSDSPIWWATYTPGHWDPNVRIGSQASTATPSLAAFNGFVYMTHLGANKGETQLWFDRFDPATWSWRPDFQLPYRSTGSPTISIPNQGMDGFAALAALPTQLRMVHKARSNNTLWYSVFQ